MSVTAIRRILLFAVVVSSLSVWAQTKYTESQRFPVERMRLSANRTGLLDVEWGDLPQHLAWDVGLWLSYSRNPLVVYDLSNTKRLGPLVENRLGGGLVASLGLFNWVEIGFELPVVWYQSRPAEMPLALQPGTILSNLPTTMVGDFRLMPKVRILRQKDHWLSLAVILGVSAPSGGSRAYFGEAGWTFLPELALSHNFNHFRIGLNLGATVRAASQTLNQTAEHEMMGRLGVGYRLADLEGNGIPLEFDLALTSAFSILKPFRTFNQNYVELKGAVLYDFTRMFQMFLGGGFGIGRGFGSPDFRVFIGARLGDNGKRPAPKPKPVVVVPPPPPKDTDGDGIFDDKDRCPSDPEDKDDFEDEDGCPDPDNDKDGLVDEKDKCPMVPGIIENKGCPDTDKDGDGVVDRLDNCPEEPGVKENQGCAKKQLVAITSERLEILQSVYFKLGKDIIETRSFELLNNVASVLKNHPEVEQVTIEGHTDSQGNPEKNIDLSQRRANSVKKYLVEHGIESKRLATRGYGQTKPVADNKTNAGRAQNRRVVFTIEQAPGIQQGNEGPGKDTIEPSPGERK